MNKERLGAFTDDWRFQLICYELLPHRLVNGFTSLGGRHDTNNFSS